jgi:hypothetical protein
MAKLITLKESELFNMVKNIVEQVEVDLSQYDDNDFTDAFVFLFRNWIVNKLGDESKKYPFSFLLKKYGQKFLEESFGDKYSKYFSDRDVDFSRYMIPRIGKYLIQSGVHSLPSLRGEEKFTEKYGKHLQRLIKQLEIPSWVKIEIKEDIPNDVVVNLIVDYPSYLKESSSLLNQYTLQKKLKTILEDYLGIEFGNPVHGELRLNLNVLSENEEAWVKNVLNKEIKKHIKSMPNGKYVHSIRFEPKINGSSELRIVYREHSHRHMHLYEFRNNVREYLKGLGYHKIDVENV